MLTDVQLVQLADDCLTKMDGSGPLDHPAYLLTAQLYMNEIDKRHDAKIARRDFVMELTVIALILAEVIFGIVDGNKRARILDQMSESTSKTANVTKQVSVSSLQQADHLQRLIDEQTKSLDALKTTNDILQSSVRQTAKSTTPPFSLVFLVGSRLSKASTLLSATFMCFSPRDASLPGTLPS
jgi:hypothetical protein